MEGWQEDGMKTGKTRSYKGDQTGRSVKWVRKEVQDGLQADRS